MIAEQWMGDDSKRMKQNRLNKIKSYKMATLQKMMRDGRIEFTHDKLPSGYVEIRWLRTNTRDMIIVVD